jgi:hypothetical protein
MPFVRGDGDLAGRQRVSENLRLISHRPRRGTVKKVLTLVAVTAAAMGLLTGGASASKVHKQVRYVRIVPTSGWNVDNNPSGNSGGDLFGSAGDLRHSGSTVGSYTSACTASSDALAQCQATLVFNSGKRLQLAGQFELQEAENQLAIVGGTGRYKKARGEAIIKTDSSNPGIQKVKLKILL